MNTSSDREKEDNFDDLIGSSSIDDEKLSSEDYDTGTDQLDDDGGEEYIEDKDLPKRENNNSSNTSSSEYSNQTSNGNSEQQQQHQYNNDNNGNKSDNYYNHEQSNADPCQLKNQIFQSFSDDIKGELTDNKWEVIRYASPLILVVARDRYNQIVETKLPKEEVYEHDEKGNKTGNYHLEYKLHYTNVVIGAIPLKVTHEIDPLRSTELKYTIDFATHVGNRFTITSKTIQEITIELREKGLVFKPTGAAECLGIMLGAFEKSGEIKVNEDVKTPGFYLLDEDSKDSTKKEIKGYNIERHVPRPEEIQKCADLLHFLATTKYRRPEVFATLVKWAIMAPFSYVLKQLGKKYIEWIHLHGSSSSGKTMLGLLALAIWNLHRNSNHSISYTKIDTVAKLGEALSKSTFPIIVNEVGSLSEDRYQSRIIEMIKAAIETKVARAKFEGMTRYKDIPAYSACIFTSNVAPPTEAGFRRRFIDIVFTDKDQLDRDNPEDLKKIKEFEQLLSDHINELATLGYFATNYILEHQREFLIDNKSDMNLWQEASTKVLSELFKAADWRSSRDEAVKEKNQSLPEWINYIIHSSQLENVKEENGLLLRQFFLNLINKRYRENVGKIDSTHSADSIVPNLRIMNKLEFCLENNLIPFVHVRHVHTNNNSSIKTNDYDYNGNSNNEDNNRPVGSRDIIITHDIFHELREAKLDRIATSLGGLASMIPSFKDGTKKLGKSKTAKARLWRYK